ncbi:MAG: ABC transporter substrate-binding protein [Burkholderiaceae bacterium]|nr:ABC transporter substrate-binding protein [Burkholderiaceae bacterium]
MRGALRPGLALGLTACLAVAQAAPLTVCTEAAPDGFDIAQSESAVTVDAVGNTIFDQLLMYKRGTTEFVPGLARAWRLSADGLQLTLELRPGVKFHSTPWFTPTHDMNADDVLFSFQRMADAKSPWQAVAKGGFLMWHGTGMGDAIKTVEKLDAMTVRLQLKQPNALMQTLLANQFNSSVYSAEYGAQLLKVGKPELINTQPVGTGPFVFKSYQKDAVLRLSAHPGYWGIKPQFDQLVVAITPDANVRVQRLKAGECMIGANMRGETLGGFDGTAVKVQSEVGLLTGYIALNTQRKFLSDKRFRQALALGFNRASYIQSVYGGRALPAASFLPPSQWSHDNALSSRYDVDQAKALVKASGYDGTELAIFTRIGGSIDGRRAAELMQADWAKIGVKVRVQMMEWGEMLRRTGAGEHDITFLNWAGDGDPDSFFNPNLSCEGVNAGNNKSRWCNKAFDAMLAKARANNDQGQRSLLYGQAQRLVADEVPLIPTVYPQYFTAVSQRVKGFKSSPFADLDFRGVSVP